VSHCRLFSAWSVEPGSTLPALVASPGQQLAPHGVVAASAVECALRRHAPWVTGNRAHLVDLAGDRRSDIIDV
jgi:hypothetical protein